VPDVEVKHSPIEGLGVFVARRDIATGEEITFDYNINTSGGNSWPCHCGAARCRGESVGDFFSLSKQQQREYRPILAEWFVKKHSARIAALDGAG